MKESSESLGVEKIWKLLIEYSLPAIVGTTATSLYNIIDRIFIGQGVGPLAISGLALAFPLMNLAIAFGAFIGMGASVMVSIRLGQKDNAGASSFLGTACVLNIVIGGLYTIVMFIFLDDILYVFGASIDTLPFARDFMQVILAGNVFTHLYFGLNSIMRASGHPRKAMNVTLITIGINIVLAPLFIFLFHWGIRGAAAATILAQISGVIMVFRHFLKKNSTVRFIHGCFKLKWKTIKEIISIGSANFIMIVLISLVVMIFNLKLEKYSGDLAIGAFGIINSMATFFVMVVLGFNQGIQPIAGYNYGARNIQRVITVLKYSLAAGSSITVLGFLLMQIFPEMISRMFTTSIELIEISIPGMRLYTAAFFMVGFQVVVSSFFQALGKASVSIFLSLSRQALLLIPALLILPGFFGLTGIWISAPAADFISTLLSVIVLRIEYPKLKNLIN
ncbi:MAG: MATE family efflux transporter [Bacteroidetes bacterium]|nr:MATE family efflux transporter [Bacteroidota bacterium]